MTGPAGGALRFARFLLAGKSKTQKKPAKRSGCHLYEVATSPMSPPPRGRLPITLKGDAQRALPLKGVPTTLIYKINKVVGIGQVFTYTGENPPQATPPWAPPMAVGNYLLPTGKKPKLGARPEVVALITLWFFMDRTWVLR